MDPFAAILGLKELRERQSAARQAVMGQAVSLGVEAGMRGEQLRQEREQRQQQMQLEREKLQLEQQRTEAAVEEMRALRNTMEQGALRQAATLFHDDLTAIERELLAVPTVQQEAARWTEASNAAMRNLLSVANSYRQNITQLSTLLARNDAKFTAQLQGLIRADTNLLNAALQRATLTEGQRTGEVDQYLKQLSETRDRLAQELQSNYPDTAVQITGFLENQDQLIGKPTPTAGGGIQYEGGLMQLARQLLDEARGRWQQLQAVNRQEAAAGKPALEPEMLQRYRLDTQLYQAAVLAPTLADYNSIQRALLEQSGMRMTATAPTGKPVGVELLKSAVTADPAIQPEQAAQLMQQLDTMSDKLGLLYDAQLKREPAMAAPPRLQLERRNLNVARSLAEIVVNNKSLLDNQQYDEVTKQWDALIQRIDKMIADIESAQKQPQPGELPLTKP